MREYRLCSQTRLCLALIVHGKTGHQKEMPFHAICTPRHIRMKATTLKIPVDRGWRNRVGHLWRVGVANVDCSAQKCRRDRDTTIPSHFPSQIILRGVCAKRQHHDEGSRARRDRKGKWIEDLSIQILVIGRRATFDLLTLASVVCASIPFKQYCPCCRRDDHIPGRLNNRE
jgi:hypothetical protein